MRKSTVLWIVAFLITLGSAFWQKTTGPTYPIRFGEQLGQVEIKGKLLRTHSINGDLPVRIEINGSSDRVTGEVVWRRYPTNDEWSRQALVLEQGELRTTLPAQPAAGKLEYRVELEAAGAQLVLPADETAVARFKGDVPVAVLIVHVACMFLGMLWSLRTGFEAFARGPALRRQALVTLLLIGVGGLLLGPVVQKYAFDAYWTGWPLGEDLTDNKLAVAVLFWVIAVVRTRARPSQGKLASRCTPGRWWAVAAMVVTLVIFAIPHSLHGSTLDYETMEHVQG